MAQSIALLLTAEPGGLKRLGEVYERRRAALGPKASAQAAQWPSDALNDLTMERALPVADPTIQGSATRLRKAIRPAIGRETAQALLDDVHIGHGLAAMRALDSRRIGSVVAPAFEARALHIPGVAGGLHSIAQYTATSTMRIMATRTRSAADHHLEAAWNKCRQEMVSCGASSSRHNAHCACGCILRDRKEAAGGDFRRTPSDVRSPIKQREQRPG